MNHGLGTSLEADGRNTERDEPTGQRKNESRTRPGVRRQGDQQGKPASLVGEETRIKTSTGVRMN
jgi:hypothetical protein